MLIYISFTCKGVSYLSTCVDYFALPEKCCENLNFPTHLSLMTYCWEKPTNLSKTFWANYTGFSVLMAKLFGCDLFFLKGEMHKKAYDLIWLHFSAFFGFWVFFLWSPLENYEKKVVLGQIWAHSSNDLEKTSLCWEFH